MKKVTTFTAQIFVGLTEGYDGANHQVFEVSCICQDFVNELGWCVSVTPTQFVYKDGYENGAIVGIINYPRFPLEVPEIKNRTLKLAKLLMKEMKQYRVSVVFSDETIMLENGRLKEKQ